MNIRLFLKIYFPIPYPYKQSKYKYIYRNYILKYLDIRNHFAMILRYQQKIITKK